MVKLYTRWQKSTVESALKSRRVILLSGPRQCGKTTLAKELSKKDSQYVTLDNLAVREIAVNDPKGFVSQKNHLFIIDEVQRVPELLSAIKMVVDENTKSGQFLLTGSADIQSLPGVQESLAGRIRKIRLRPLSQGELLGRSPTFLDMAFDKLFSKFTESCTRNDMLKISLRGGFPEAIRLEPAERRQWHRDYINSLLERDLKEIARITRHQAMRELLLTLAAWSGKFMDISAIGASLAIRRPTLESYINALEALFVIERIQPWTHTDYERVGKQSKCYMADSGLMASLLRWRMEQVVMDSDRSGKLIETFVFNELAALVDASNGKYELFHYRDREQREIDFVIERDDHALLGIEVKSGSSIGSADFKHLKWFRDNIVKDRPFVGIVLYSGEMAGSMGDRLWAVPFTALWQG